MAGAGKGNTGLRDIADLYSWIQHLLLFDFVVRCFGNEERRFKRDIENIEVQFISHILLFAHLLNIVLFVVVFLYYEWLFLQEIEADTGGRRVIEKKPTKL